MSKDPRLLRILVADDHDVVRHGLRALIEAKPGWQVCGEATNGQDAAAMAQELQPDIAILDVSMPMLNGLEATRLIRKASPATEVLVFTMHESEQLIRDVLAAGARGYLLKSDTGHSLVTALEALAAHRPYFNWKVSETILEGFLRATPEEDAGGARETLTAREREIVQLLAEGLRTKDIAERLGITAKTVETHRAAVMRKLDAHSVVDLVRYAMRNRIASL